MVCLGVGADVMPPDVAALGEKVDFAQRKLGGIRAEMAATQRKYAIMDMKLRRATTTLLRAQQFPQGFWMMRAVVNGQPGAADIASMAVKQGVADVAAVDSRVKDLRALYGEVNSEVAALREVEENYRAARGKLSGAQKEALRQAMVRADDLALKIAGVKDVSGDVPAPLELPTEQDTQVVLQQEDRVAPKMPVEGKVIQAFRRGRGATQEGVVLHGKKGADVRSMVSGEVLYSGPFRQFGGLVIVKSEKGEDVLFGGLGSLRVATGNHVLAGDVLGGLGDDGRLYWEVRKRGRTVNPLASR